MRVAYDWSRDTWRRIYERAGAGGGSSQGRRGWVEGDSRDEPYRGRIGAAYQAAIEEDAQREDEDTAVRMDEADLWAGTRLGEPREGEWRGGWTDGGWREAYGSGGIWRVHTEAWRGGRRIRPSSRVPCSFFSPTIGGPPPPQRASMRCAIPPPGDGLLGPPVPTDCRAPSPGVLTPTCPAQERSSELQTDLAK